VRKVGLHLRIEQDLTELIQKAVRLDIPCFQFFITDRKSGCVRQLIREDLQRFLTFKCQYFDNLYLHSSYLINLADASRKHHPLLMWEIRVAIMLGCKYLVFHPGYVNSLEEKRGGIDSIARSLNYILRRERNINFLLENTGHGQLSIGSNIEDFKSILEKIDYVDRVGFCLDTVHAHVSGYDIVSATGYTNFINLIEENIGLEKVKLIHLNDTKQSCSSQADIHCCISEKDSKLGKEVLKRFIHDERLKDVDYLIEMPKVSEEKELQILDRVSGWWSM